MKGKRVPKQRQRSNVRNRSPDHRGTGLGRELRARRRLAITVVGAENVTGASFDTAEHHRLAHERDAGQAATAMTDRLADEEHSRTDRRELGEVELQIATADG